MEFENSHIKKSEKTSWTSFFRQGLVAVILWTSYIDSGLFMGSTTVAIPQLRKEANSTDAVSNEMVSWISSIFGLSGFISLFIVVPMAHFIGRKFIMSSLAVSTIIASSVMFFSKTATHLLIGQIIMGLTSAAQSSVYLFMLTEYSSPRNRGLFLTIKSATHYWGMWIANTIGIFTHYKYCGIVGIICSGFSFIISLFIPESPYWLAFRGRYDECAVAHRWLMGINEDSEKALDGLIKAQKKIVEDSTESFGQYLKNCLTALKQPDIYKPLLLCCIVTSIYNFSGKLICAVYAIEMMKKVSGNQSTVYIGVLVLDGFSVLGMYVGCGLSKILKRRTLLLSTSITGTAFLFAMSSYLYLIKLSVLPENDYLMLAMLVGYSLAVCCGPIVLATSISAELLPIRFRSFCGFIFSMFTLFILSTTVKLSPYMFNSVGFHGAYLCFGVCSTIFITLTYVYLPETKDRPLHEIAEIFKPKEQKDATQSKLLHSSY